MSDTGSPILITGGLGYLGGRIATYLASAAPELTLRLTTRKSPEQRPLWSQSLEVVRADLLDRDSLISALDGIDTVIHLAAVNEVESQMNPEVALEVNGKGTYQLLQACRTRGVNRFIYFSTFHVYGPGAPQPITEATPTRPVHPYAITHRLAEDFVNWHRHSYGMETVILRLSNAYGYPTDPMVQRWTLVFNDLCFQAVRERKIQLRTRGTQERDFIPLTDVARAVKHLLDLPFGGWRSGLFNLGGECSMSIYEVAQRIAGEYVHCYGKEVPIITGEDEESQVAGPVVYSIEELKDTGFSLAGSLPDEVRQTFKLCEQMESRGR